MNSGILQKVFNSNNSTLLVSVSALSYDKDIAILIAINDITNIYDVKLVMSTSMLENGTSCYVNHLTGDKFYSVSDIKGLYHRSTVGYNKDTCSEIADFIQLSSVKLSGIIGL